MRSESWPIEEERSPSFEWQSDARLRWVFDERWKRWVDRRVNIDTDRVRPVELPDECATFRPEKPNNDLRWEPEVTSSSLHWPSLKKIEDAKRKDGRKSPFLIQLWVEIELQPVDCASRKRQVRSAKIQVSARRVQSSVSVEGRDWAIAHLPTSVWLMATVAANRSLEDDLWENWGRDNEVRPCCPTTQIRRTLGLHIVGKQLKRGRRRKKKK